MSISKNSAPRSLLRHYVTTECVWNLAATAFEDYDGIFRRELLIDIAIATSQLTAGMLFGLKISDYYVPVEEVRSWIMECLEIITAVATEDLFSVKNGAWGMATND